jgi:hypothetical protein
VTNNSITLIWSGYGVSGTDPYYVGKFNGSQWVYTPVTGTTWTDFDVQPGAWYYYTVWPKNSAGFGRAVFNGSYLTASTLFAQKAPPPSYEVTFIANNQIRFTFNKPGATSYIVRKKVNGQWVTKQTGTQGVYTETVAPESQNEYAVAAKVNGAWTEYTNGGSFTIRAYPTRPGR